MKTKQWIITLIGGLTLFRLFFINTFPLLGDEAYYWQWARHLDFGYYEQGPMVALVIFICTLFTKISTVFTIRLGAVLLSLGTMIVMYFTYKKLKPEDEKSNLLHLALISSSLLYAVGAVLMMHDTVMVFFYALFLYNFTNILKEPENNMHWGHAGILLGLAIMSKYTAGVIYFGMAAFLIFTGTFRKYLKGFIFFTLFTLLFTTPVIYWNFTHDFTTVKYLMIRSGVKSGFTIKYLLELLGSQAALLSPMLFIVFIFACVSALKKPAFDARYGFTTLAWVSLAPFVLLSLKGRVEANWPAFAFLPLFYITADYISSLNPPLKKRVVSSVLITGFALVIIAFAAAANSYSLPEKINPLRKAYGYKELAEKTYKIYNEYRDNDRVFLAARHYQAASLLSFYTPGQPDYFVLIPHESSKNYRFWKGYEKYKNGSCIFVYSDPWESSENTKFFNKALKTEEVKIKFGNYGINTYKVDVLEGLK